jgi:hypothetical protein
MVKKLLQLAVVISIFIISCSSESNSEIKWLSFEEGLKKAKQENKLILMDIYGKWCHWCNVMENTTYRNRKVIELINKYYIPVRVDADKYPDINKKYNQGGLPSTLILDKDGNIVFGGIYIPPDDMIRILNKFAKMSPEEIQKYVKKNKSIQNLRFKKFTKKLKEKEINPTFINITYQVFSKKFDEFYGGFEGAPKFPNEELPYFLMLHSLFNGSTTSHLTKTLEGYAKLIDLVEGGIYRYGTMEDWSEPHYEKLLKDQGELSVLFFDSFSFLNDKRYLEYANKILKFTKSKLYDKKLNLFFNSQGADIIDKHGTILVSGEEFFTKSKEEREEIIKSVGYSPNIDKTIYFGNNALIVKSLFYSSVFNENQKDLILAEKVLKNIKKYGLTKKGIKHTRDVDKYYLNAQVYYLEALITAYEITGDKNYFKEMVNFSDLLIKNYYSKNIGIFTDLKEVGLNQKRISFIDDIYSLNSKLVKDLYAVHILTGEEKYRKIMEKLTKSLPRDLKLSIALAYYYYLYPPLSTHIIGKQKDKTIFIQNGFKSFPFYNYVQFISKKDKDMIEKLGYKSEDKTVAYICNFQTCFSKIQNPENIKETIFKILKNYKPVSEFKLN